MEKLTYKKGDIVRLKKIKSIKARLRGNVAEITKVHTHNYTAKIDNQHYALYGWMIAYKLQKRTALWKAIRGTEPFYIDDGKN